MLAHLHSLPLLSMYVLAMRRFAGLFWCGFANTEGGGPQEEVPATVLFADRAFSSVNGRLRLFSEGFSFWAPGCVPVVVSMAPATTGSLPVASAGIVDVPEIPGLLLLLVKVGDGGSFGSRGDE